MTNTSAVVSLFICETCTNITCWLCKGNPYYDKAMAFPKQNREHRVEIAEFREFVKYKGCLRHSGIPRPEVMNFAKAMETTLRKNDYKGGWSEMSLGTIFALVLTEIREAEAAWEAVNKREHYERVSEELIDVANFCMMFYDNLHLVEVKENEPR